MPRLEARDAMARVEQVCTDMPRQGCEMSGRLQANEYAMPRLPRHVPTQKSMGWEDTSSRGESGGQKLNAPHFQSRVNNG